MKWFSRRILRVICHALAISSFLGILAPQNARAEVIEVEGKKFDVNKLIADPDVLNYLGELFGQRKEYFESLLFYSEAIRINPSFHEAFKNRALVFLKLKKIEYALKDFKDALRLGSKDPIVKTQIELLRKKVKER